MKSETSVFTVRLPVPLQEKLAALAEGMDRSRSWLVTQALEEYVRYQEWFVAQVKEGIAAADRGDFASEKEMETLWKKYNVPRP